MDYVEQLCSCMEVLSRHSGAFEEEPPGPDAGVDAHLAYIDRLRGYVRGVAPTDWVLSYAPSATPEMVRMVLCWLALGLAVDLIGVEDRMTLYP